LREVHDHFASKSIKGEIVITVEGKTHDKHKVINEDDALED
jgi:hypothetical protein